MLEKTFTPRDFTNIIILIIFSLSKVCVILQSVLFGLLFFAYPKNKAH